MTRYGLIALRRAIITLPAMLSLASVEAASNIIHVYGSDQGHHLSQMPWQTVPTHTSSPGPAPSTERPKFNRNPKNP